MHKTVIYEEIDGHKIIRGIDNPTVDGVATNRIVFGEDGESGLIHDTPEWQAVEAKKAEYNGALKELSALQGKFKKGAKVPRDAQEQWNHASTKAKIYQDELKPLARAREDKIIVLRREKAVYFEPRKGEIIRDASEVDGLVGAIQGKPQGTFITLDGATIEDNRGRVYFRKVSKKWGRTQIVKLGDKVPADAVTEPDEMQKTEIERDRVAALPADVKLKEKERAMALAIKGAADMRSRLEIQADPDALTKSQDWYQAEVARIDGLYG